MEAARCSKGPENRFSPGPDSDGAMDTTSVVLHCALHSAPLWASPLANSCCFYDAACIQQVEPGMHFHGPREAVGVLLSVGVWCVMVCRCLCIAGFTCIRFYCSQHAFQEEG